MGYKSRLAGDLDRWIGKGWIDAARRDDILGDIPDPVRRWTAIGALAILGAVLLAMAALTFVAANWDAMPRLLRFATILAALWISLLGAGRAFDRGAGVLGHALAVLGAALFGAAIMLTAQTFNMTSFRNTAVLVWAAAALVTALAIPSRPVLILATLLGGLWGGLEIASDQAATVVWGYLPVWAVTAALALRLGSKVSMHLLALGLVLWGAHALHRYEVNTDIATISVQAVGALLYGAVALGGALARDRGMPGGGILAGWTAVAAVILAMALQVRIDASIDGTVMGGAYIGPSMAALGLILLVGILRLSWGRLRLVPAAGLLAVGAIVFVLPPLASAAAPGMSWLVELVYGALFYAGAVALILQGSSEQARATGAIGIAAFAGQTFYVYAETFGGLLDTALFFFVGGAILFAMAAGLWAWRRRRDAQPATGGEA